MTDDMTGKSGKYRPRDLLEIYWTGLSTDIDRFTSVQVVHILEISTEEYCSGTIDIVVSVADPQGESSKSIRVSVVSWSVRPKRRWRWRWRRRIPHIILMVCSYRARAGARLYDTCPWDRAQSTGRVLEMADLGRLCDVRG